MNEQLSDSEFQKFQEIIYQQSGIRVRDNKRLLLSNRIRRRLKVLDEVNDFSSYLRLVKSASTELVEFLNVVTTNETSFFRTPDHFDWFRQDFTRECIHQVNAGTRSPGMHVWSAACSSGEEAYSLAICCRENQLRLRDWPLEIIGTDLSETILKSARAGRYGPRSMEAITETQKRRYFEKPDVNDCRAVQPALRELVTFEKHNLIKPWPGKPFDCIFIRNVLIYFDRESKATVVKHLLSALRPNGYLVVGPSEGIYDMLTTCQKIKPFLYQKK